MSVSQATAVEGRLRAVPSRRAPAMLVLPTLAAILVVNIPLVYLVLRSVRGGWRLYSDHVFSLKTLSLLGQTLGLVAGVVALSLCLALPWAWLVTRTDLPWRRFWAVVGALPLVFPSYVGAFSLVAVLGPRGLAATWLAPLGVERIPALAYGYSGALLALALFHFPYIYLLLVGALRSLDGRLEEASRTLGAGPWKTFFRVVWPQLRPATYGGALLIALYTVSDFGAVSIVRYNTLTLSIYNAYGALFDRTVAAAISTVLVATAIALVFGQSMVLRRSRPAPPVLSPPRRIPLGRWRVPCTLGLAFAGSLTLGLPLVVIGYWTQQALRLGGAVSLAAPTALNSFTVSAAAAVAAVIAALPVAIWVVRYPSAVARWGERLCYTGHALPGLVIALALVFLASRHLVPLYQTLLLLVVGYVIRFLPEALSASRAALAGVAPVIEEAARSLGRDRWAVWRSVTFPLIRPGLLAGLGLVFLTTMKELPATLLLRPTGFETLATQIWASASEGIYSEAAIPSMLLVLVSSVPVYRFIIRPVLAERSQAVVREAKSYGNP